MSYVRGKIGWRRTGTEGRMICWAPTDRVVPAATAAAAASASAADEAAINVRTGVLW